MSATGCHADLDVRRREGVDSGCTDEVIFRQAAHRVCAVVNDTVLVANFQVRVMILLMSDPGQCIDKCNCLVIVFEAEAALDRLTAFVG